MKFLGFKIIEEKFFSRPTLKVARDLIDKYLVTKRFGKICGGRIVETEAYLGLEDKASHASVGITRRNKIMYGRPGFIYVYLIYGMHYCFNVVCEEEGIPGAVLIRAIEPEIGIETMRKRRAKNRLEDLASGPAKLAQALKIGRIHNGKKLSPQYISILDDGFPRRKIMVGPRIGITNGNHLNYRFFVKENRFVSA